MRQISFRSNRLATALACASLVLVYLPAQDPYPPIQSLVRGDPSFDEQQVRVREFYRQASAGERLPSLNLYRYEIRESDTLFAIAARLSIPYSAVSTLNRMESPEISEAGGQILLPSIPGVFVPLEPETDLELLMHDLRREQEARIVRIVNRGASTNFRFFPGDDFSADERSAFLGLLFRSPLRTLSVTSPFGPRTHPVTGVWGFHAGVDLAAAPGSPVLAARSGTVAATGTDPAMGNYILLKHTGGFTTFYGHLDAVTVSLNDPVRSGMMIGTVGSTGVTTGSHLHFEIRQNDDPRDPMKLLP